MKTDMAEASPVQSPGSDGQDHRHSWAAIFNDPRKALLALYLLMLPVFWSTFSFGYVNYDDYRLVVNNPVVQDLSVSNLKYMFTHFYPQSYYPVRLASLALDYAYWQGNPIGFHITNLILHMFNCLLVFWLFMRLAGDGEKWAAWGAFVAAGIMGVHPVVVEPVAWIPGREELLLFFFSLWSMHFQLYAHEERKRGVWLTLSALACALACLSHVMAVGIPVIASLYLLASGRERWLTAIIRRTWFLWLLVLAAVALKVLGLLSWDSQRGVSTYPYIPSAILHMGELWPDWQGLAPHSQGFFERIQTVLHVLGSNIGHVLFPKDLPIFYKPELPVLWTDYPAILGLTALIGVGAWFFMEKRGVEWFCLAWFVLVLALTSQVFPTFIWRADRFIYLPLAGLALFMGLVAIKVNVRFGENLGGAIFLSLILLMGAKTIMHLPVYKSEAVFHQYVVNQNPHFYMVHDNMGDEHLRIGMFDEALAEYEEALRLKPDIHYVWDKVLKTVILGGQFAKGIAMGEQAIVEQPENAYRHNYLGAVLSHAGQLRLAEKHFRKAAELDPEAVEPLHNLGLALMGRGNSVEAVYYLKKAHELAPENGRICLDLAIALENTGQDQKAMEMYKKAARDPAFPQAKGALERLIRNQHRPAGRSMGV